MAIHLMTGTGTQADVNAALGIAAGSAPDTENVSVGPIAGVVDKRPDPPKTEAAAEAPVTPPEPVAAAGDAAPPADEPIPDTEFDPETGDPLTERASRSPRTKLQTIKHLRKRAQAAEAERETFRERAARLEGELSAYKMGTPPPPPSAPPSAAPAAPQEPKEADYDTYESYIDARTEYRTKLAVAAALQADREARDQEARQRAAEQARQTVQSRIEAFREAHDDYDDTINNPSLKVSDPMIAVLTDPENEHGPAMAYALGKDPARCAKIAALPAHRALMEMGVLQTEIAAQSNGKPASASSPEPVKPTVPPPPTPLRGGSVTAVRNLDDIAKAGDVQAWRQMRQAQRQARLAK